MQTGARETVCQIRERVANRIGPRRFDTWFGESAEFSLEGDQLGVCVPNAFVRQWISSNFMEPLMDATREVLGGEPRIDIRIAVNPCDAVPVAATAHPPRPAGDGHRPSVRESSAAPTVLRGELETFVVGPSNQLAHSAASDLIRAPGQGLRLLVVHGGCGLGKTHLLQGICNGVRQAHPSFEWRYISGEEFTNQFVQAVKTGRVDAFRARFRTVDVLAIDDIHFLANKKATQEEFLHTFNAVDAAGKAIVLSSDRHPRSIATLSEPLINRLIAGMVVQIEPPDFQMRREILRRRVSAMGAELPDEVLSFVARRVTRNVRALEGALYKLVAYASLAREPMNLELARHAIEDYVDAVQLPDVADIERVVANYFAVTRDAVHSRLRDRTTSLARALTMYLIRKHTQLSFPEIGRALGHKNHSTVLMAVQRVERALDRNGAVAWTTSAGLREASVRDVLQVLEHDLPQGRRASA